MYVRVRISLPYIALLSTLLAEFYYYSLICQVYISSQVVHLIWVRMVSYTYSNCSELWVMCCKSLANDYDIINSMRFKKFSLLTVSYFSSNQESAYLNNHAFNFPINM